MAIRLVALCIATIVATSTYGAEIDPPTSISYLQTSSTFTEDGALQFVSHSEVFIREHRKREVNEMGQVTITDGRSGDMVTIVPKLRRFVRYDGASGKKQDKDEKTMAIDFRASLTPPSGDDAERVGSLMIDGQQVIALRTSTKRANSQSARTFCYEEATNRPRMVTVKTGAKGSQTHVVELSRFRFTPLDPALFSMEAPEGYTALRGDASKMTFSKTKKQPSGITNDSY